MSRIPRGMEEPEQGSAAVHRRWRVPTGFWSTEDLDARSLELVSPLDIR